MNLVDAEEPFWRRAGKAGDYNAKPELLDPLFCR
jgi:hypothetical protein